MPTDTYSISDLARLTGVSVRTIRYYLAQGLIPASGESGPGAHYGEGHLGRLRLIRRLQQQHLPLAEIRARLAALTDAEIAAAAGAEAPAPNAPSTSALDYVRSVLAGAHTTVPPAQMAPSRPVAPAPLFADMSTSMPPAPGAPNTAGRILRRMAAPFVAEARGAVSEPPLPLAAAMPASPEPTPPSIERSQWERLSLGPNLELHVRRPLGRLEQKRVERLITIARQVLKEEQP